MYEHAQKRIAFIAHPRTASSATGHILLDTGFVIRQHHHAFDPTWNLDGWKVFCTVRNPLDLMVSWYYNKPREKSFDIWLPKFLDGCSYLQDERIFFGRPYCTHVLHFETLQQDFNKWLDDVGLPPMVIPLRNVSKVRKGRSFMGHYNFERIRMVLQRFRVDFEENDYPIP